MIYYRTYGGMEKTRKIDNIPWYLLKPEKRTRQRQDLIDNNN